MARTRSRAAKSLLALATLVCATLVSGIGGPAQAAFLPHTGLVPQDPARGYPIISELPRVAGTDAPRQVYAADQAGRYIVAGGDFLNVELQNGTIEPQPYFTAWNIDTKQLVCPNVTFDNEVLAVEPGPAPDTVYVGGRFAKITGPDGVARTRNRIALLRLPDCSVDTTFVSPTPSAKVEEIVLTGNRLFVGGDFTTIGGQSIRNLAELNPTTGAVQTRFAYTFSGGSTSPVVGMAANPAGTRLVVGGRFGTVSGNGVSVNAPTAVFDISNPATPRLTSHSSTGYSGSWGALPITHLQDVGISPDADLVALVYGTATTSDYVFLTPTTESAVGVRWKHYMRDSSFGVAVSNNAVYVGGHFCKPDSGPGATDLMAPVAGVASDCTGSGQTGGVWRSHLAALSLTDGTPLTWNPGNNSFRGASELTVTTRGLLVGSDGERTNTVRTGTLSFLDFGPQVEDTAPPSAVTFTAPAAGATVDRPARFTGTATDNVGVVSFKVAIRASDNRWLQSDGVTLGTTRYDFTPAATPPGGTTAGFTLDVSPPAGSYTAQATATDVAGLSSTTSTLAFVGSGIDTVPPTASITGPGTTTAGSSATVTGTAADNLAVSSLQLTVRDAGGLYLQADGSFGAAPATRTPVAGPALPASSVTWSAALGTGLPVGSYALSLAAGDGSGTTTATGSLIVSASPPTVSVTSPAAGASVVQATAVTLAGTAADNAAVASVTVSVTAADGRILQDDGTLASAANTLPITVTGLGKTSASWTYPAGSALPLGGYTISASATDNGGATTSTSSAFTVVVADPKPAVATYTGYSSSLFGGNYTMGYTFTVDTAKTVTALGVHDTNRNGRNDNTSTTPVGLWRSSDQLLLASGSVAGNATATGGWAYTTLATPVTLQPGVTYVIGQKTYFGLVGIEEYAQNGTMTFLSGVRFGTRVYTSSTSLTYPSTNGGTSFGYGAPNLMLR